MIPGTLMDEVYSWVSYLTESFEMRYYTNNHQTEHLSMLNEGMLTNIFSAGLAAGVTEAVAVVTPMEVIKIRLQAQHHSMADPLDIPKYRYAAHALYTVVKEEGIGALYRGISLTALRQGTLPNFKI